MISVTNDISRVPGEKSIYDTLTGSVTIHDFSDHIRDLLPNFYNQVVYIKKTHVGQTLEILHKLTNMPGDPIDCKQNVRSPDLPEYLHSLFLAIQANRERIEAIYTSVE